MFFTHYSLHGPLRIGRILFKYYNVPLSRKTITTTPIRSDIFNIGKRMKKEEYYKKLDKIEPTYELIYRAPFEYMAAFCRHVPTLSLTLVTAFSAYKLAIGLSVIGSDTVVSYGAISSDGLELQIFFGLFYFVNISLAYAVSKYPLRIYKLKNQYCAMFEGYLPFSPRQYSFRKGDLCKTKSILPWHEVIYKMKDRKVLVYSHHFRKPADFNDLLKK